MYELPQRAFRLVLTLQRHLIFSHAWSLIYPYHNDHTALDHYNRESRLNGRWDKQGMRVSDETDSR